MPQIGFPLPFNAEVPAGAGVKLSVDIALSGAIGHTYSYRSQNKINGIWVQGDGVFGTDECTAISVAAPDTPGDYTWTFSYDGKLDPSTSSLPWSKGECTLPIVTKITLEQPSPAALTSKTFVLGYGIYQYRAWPMNCP
jgi:hypothetical protein